MTSTTRCPSPRTSRTVRSATCDPTSAPTRSSPTPSSLPWRGTAAGGGYSTVGDLARFADALTSHELLTPASTELLVTGKIDLGYGLKYAFGFLDSRDEEGNGSVGHGGGSPG